MDVFTDTKEVVEPDFSLIKPPQGCELGIQETDLGEYPTLGVWTDGDPPSDYIRSCERALNVFKDAVDWNRLKNFHDERLITDEEEE